MKLKQMRPEEAEGYELKQALLTTYELDPAAVSILRRKRFPVSQERSAGKP